MLLRQIESTGAAIDRLVYALPPLGMISPSGMIYGLTEEEIKIVEGKEWLCEGLSLIAKR
jgi:hypothetical protein